jgi:RNA 3'-phosphate cyclase
MLEIDGSQGEGGGQILRTAASLSVLLEEELRVVRIRENRPKPGLAQQHLVGLKALQELASAEAEGLEIGSREVRFHPGRPAPGRYRIDVGTAGSISLLLQTLLLPAAFAPGPVELEIRGGTDVRWSPPIDYVREVFLPFVRRMGLEAEILLRQRGYYPRGGGVVEVRVYPLRKLRPLHILERGRLQGIRGRAHSLNLPAHVTKRMARAAKEVLEGYPCTIEEEAGKGPSTGAGITLWAEFEGSRLGAGSLGEIGKPAEKVGREAGEELLQYLREGTLLDPHMGDQLPPYMALAKGPSEIRVKEKTGHLETNLALLEKLLGVAFEVREEKGRGYRIRVEGIGLRP